MKKAFRDMYFKWNFDDNGSLNAKELKILSYLQIIIGIRSQILNCVVQLSADAGRAAIASI